LKKRTKKLLSLFGASLASAVAAALGAIVLGSVACGQTLSSGSTFNLIIAACLLCTIGSTAVGQSQSIDSIFPASQVGNFVLFERPDGVPVGNYSAKGQTYFFLEDGTLLNNAETARDIYMNATVEQEFIHVHNLTLIPPLLNYARFVGEGLMTDTRLPATESFNDRDCDWPFQIAILFRSESDNRRGYSFFMRRPYKEKLRIGCETNTEADFVETKLLPAPVSIYADPIHKGSFFVISNLTPCIRHFTSFGRLTRTCKNDSLFVVDALSVESAFEGLTSGSLTPSASIILIESKMKPISSLMHR
jgi:hypothetical protein